MPFSDFLAVYSILDPASTRRAGSRLTAVRRSRRGNFTKAAIYLRRSTIVWRLLVVGGQQTSARSFSHCLIAGGSLTLYLKMQLIRT
jgi:hypothetical protein